MNICELPVVEIDGPIDIHQVKSGAVYRFLNDNFNYIILIDGNTHYIPIPVFETLQELNNRCSCGQDKTCPVDEPIEWNIPGLKNPVPGKEVLPTSPRPLSVSELLELKNAGYNVKDVMSLVREGLVG